MSYLFQISVKQAVRSPSRQASPSRSSTPTKLSKPNSPSKPNSRPASPLSPTQATSTPRERTSPVHQAASTSMVAQPDTGSLSRMVKSLPLSSTRNLILQQKHEELRGVSPENTPPAYLNPLLSADWEMYKDPYAENEALQEDHDTNDEGVRRK